MKLKSCLKLSFRTYIRDEGTETTELENRLCDCLTENVVMWLVHYKSLSVHNTNCIRTKEQRRDSEDKFAFFVVQAKKNANLSSQPQPPDPKRGCDRSPSEARLCSQVLIQNGLLRVRLRSRHKYESGLTEH